jgi:hypothetical protein
MITINCRTCDEPIESMWFDENDIVTCTDCWGE